MCPCGCIGSARRAASSTKTLERRRRPAAAGDVQRRRRRRSPGCCSGIDPRVKLVSLLLLLVAGGLVHNIVGAAGALRAHAVLAAASRAAARLLRQAGLAVRARSSPGSSCFPATLQHRDPGRRRRAAVALVRPRRGLHRAGPDLGGAGRRAGSRSRSRWWCCSPSRPRGSGCWPRCARSACPGSSSWSSAWPTATSSCCSARSPTCTQARQARTVGADAARPSAPARSSAPARRAVRQVAQLSEEVHQAMVARGYTRRRRRRLDRRRLESPAWPTCVAVAVIASRWLAGRRVDLPGR